jgi:hypothetical protein
MLTGSRDLRSGITIPDEYGCFERKFAIGPYSTAAAAIASLEPNRTNSRKG